jgi:hypothetical protein
MLEMIRMQEKITRLEKESHIKYFTEHSED